MSGGGWGSAKEQAIARLVIEMAKIVRVQTAEIDADLDAEERFGAEMTKRALRAEEIIAKAAKYVREEMSCHCRKATLRSTNIGTVLCDGCALDGILLDYMETAR